MIENTSGFQIGVHVFNKSFNGPLKEKQKIKTWKLISKWHQKVVLITILRQLQFHLPINFKNNKNKQTNKLKPETYQRNISVRK